MSRTCDLTDVKVMSGNNVSHSKRKTKRKFVPNLHKLSLKSDIVGVNIKLKIASKTLRTVNKYGGLDNFLLEYRFAKLSEKAALIRRKIQRILRKRGVAEVAEAK